MICALKMVSNDYTELQIVQFYVYKPFVVRNCPYKDEQK